MECNQENQEYRDQTERRFANYYRKHRELWQSMENPDKMKISNAVRGRVVNEGMQMERMTVEDWLKHVEEMA